MAHTAKTQAPGRLDLVRDFVNTKDVEEGTDELTSPAELADWLAVAGLAHGSRESDGLFGGTSRPVDGRAGRCRVWRGRAGRRRDG